ncbi:MULTISPECIES: DUF417 family protein [Halomonas]|uniref:DUF417 family protein n=1 Tax=Halomonas TaxID=2745 RepID=UPI001C98233B|nr:MULTISPECIES: DUF417 family protein [Halomonas]MBY6207505.1 YkgB family protein [Halomonas sp. DP3Y7-2]MBY6228314.1 YkgB family protein [Halomonas sp. DP3Y7-1]MCA0916379.1 YkgB family protein [Halomonas denitrificans]
MNHNTLSRAGFYIALYGVVAILLWIGFFKYHPDEAAAIQGIVASSPLMSWLYSIASVNQVSAAIGTAEIVVGLLVAAYPISKKAGLVGGALASVIFLTTSTFLLTTPGVLHVSSLSGDTLAFPSLFGGFLAKDLVLLGASLAITGAAWKAVSEEASAKHDHLAAESA